MAGLIGALVRLASIDVPALAEQTARWRSDTEYARLLDNDPVMPITSAQSRKNNEDESVPDKNFVFMVRALADDRIVGFVSLDVNWHDQDAWVGIGIGDHADRGKGYGTDAMKLVLCYAFAELALHRVSLGVWANNERAWRSYQKAGFKIEGGVRDSGLRDGRRWDDRYMGVLRSEWRALNGNG